MRPEKRKSLENWLKEYKPPPFKTSRFDVGGHTALISVSEGEDFEFLESYYAPFRKNPEEEGGELFTIHLRRAPGAYGDPAHGFWSEDADHRVDILPVGEEAVHLIHRDYVAEWNLMTNTVEAYGPAIAKGATDTLDNIYNVVSSRVLPAYDTIILHAAAVALDGKAYVFFGDSGAGKSTLAELASSLGHRVLGGDQVLLSVSREGGALLAHTCPITISQLPRENYALDTRALPVAALIHLSRGPFRFHFQKIPEAEILRKFLRQISGRQDFFDHSHMLRLGAKFLFSTGAASGEMHYAKGHDFFQELKGAIHEGNQGAHEKQKAGL